MSYAATYLDEVAEIAGSIPRDDMERMAQGIAAIRERGGRLFIIGVGGGAGHASHAVNDFRKIAHIESYTPSDNVSELTARVNDEGWDTSYSAWLRTSRINEKDGMLVFSVGGGSREHNISMNLVQAMELATEVGAPIYAIIGKADGHAAQAAEVAIVVPSPPARRTPHVESFQAILWHLLVSHPAVEAQPGKWEEVEGVGTSTGS
ncbi:MAG: sugar isomerase family protein [Conexibacter sp.]|jgi:D-sedoheptulose 7-phosphate isomerase|nr:sugar isomerase family protein [Conexibacter sp.]